MIEAFSELGCTEAGGATPSSAPCPSEAVEGACAKSSGCIWVQAGFSQVGRLGERKWGRGRDRTLHTISASPGWAKAPAQNSPAKVPNRVPPEPHVRAFRNTARLLPGDPSKRMVSESGSLSKWREQVETRVGCWRHRRACEGAATSRLLKVVSKEA